MSALGTGVIAGVAQTALQSQQLGRQRDRRTREAQRAAAQQKEIAQIRVEGLEEADHAEDVTRIRIDHEVPNHERHDHPQRRKGHRESANDDQTTAPPSLGPNFLSHVNALPEASFEADTPPEPQSHVAAAYQHASEQEVHRLDVEG